MPALHVRNLDDAVIGALKAKARRNHRSLQGEVRSILEAAVETERTAGPRRGRGLRLHTVSVGQPRSHSRDVIYDDVDR